MDERQIEQYQDSVINSATESFWRTVREESPAKSYFLRNDWWIALILGIFGMTLVWWGHLAGLVVTAIAVTLVGWGTWFRWIHRIPEWESKPFAEFKQESPELYREVVDGLSFYHGRREGDYPLEFVVEFHPESNTRFLLLHDCYSGDEYYVHHWTVHQSLA